MHFYANREKNRETETEKEREGESSMTFDCEYRYRYQTKKRSTERGPKLWIVMALMVWCLKYRMSTCDSQQKRASVIESIGKLSVGSKNRFNVVLGRRNLHMYVCMCIILTDRYRGLENDADHWALHPGNPSDKSWRKVAILVPAHSR